VSGRKEKEKEIPASSINEKKEIPPVAVPATETLEETTTTNQSHSL
jgi:hypothetical protein